MPPALLESYCSTGLWAEETVKVLNRKYFGAFKEQRTKRRPAGLE
jgi:hypothetical protein